MSKPLAYPSTLDRHRANVHVARMASYVEELWSRSLVLDLKNSRLKHTLNSQRNFSAERRGVFLSQAGPRFDLELVQAEHHLWFFVKSVSQTTKATRLGRPRLASYAASGLARTAPSEGMDDVGRKLRVEALPAWQGRSD
jgi:hypothetical protein